MAEQLSDPDWTREHFLQEQEQPVDPVLIRAKRGVEEFRRVYEAGDEEWRALLTDTDVGQELQAMYLGLRPVLSIDAFYQEKRELIRRNVSNRFGIRGDYVYDRELVYEVITANPDIFGDYVPTQQSLDDYMEQLAHSEPTFHTILKDGILRGYPRNAVVQFASNISWTNMFRNPSYHMEALASNEQALLQGYGRGYLRISPRTVHEYQANVNRFRDEHKVELKELIEKRFSAAPEEVKRYLHTERFVQLPGFTYTLGNPTPADNDFAKSIQNVFEASGMNAYLASVASQK